MVVIEQHQEEEQQQETATTRDEESRRKTDDQPESEGLPSASSREMKKKKDEDDEEEDSFEDALTDEQLQQKALNHANEAKLEGNKLYGSRQYEDALSKYEHALQIASELPSSVELRSNCHANRAICFFKMEKYEDTIKECTKALELNPGYVKALVRRAEAHEKLDRLEEAIGDLKKVMELDPSNDQARRSVRRLEPLAEEKREKMKEEMIGKLKEMGNSLLGKFGMSLDNFKSVKDPNTGSYSIQFQK